MGSTRNQKPAIFEPLTEQEWLFLFLFVYIGHSNINILYYFVYMLKSWFFNENQQNSRVKEVYLPPIISAPHRIATHSRLSK